MVTVADAIVDDVAVVIEAFDTSSASPAMNAGRGPEAATEEAKVIEIAVLLECSVEMPVELGELNLLGVAWISEKHRQERQHGQQEEKHMGGEQEEPSWVVAFEVLEAALVHSVHSKHKDVAADSADDRVEDGEGQHEFGTALDLVEWSVLGAAESVLLGTEAEVELELPELVLGDVAVEGDFVSNVVVLSLEYDVLLVLLEELDGSQAVAVGEVTLRSKLQHLFDDLLVKAVIILILYESGNCNMKH